MRRFFGTITMLGVVGWTGSAMGSIIADFGADYQTPTPASGWQYVHNGAGVAPGTGAPSYTVNQYNASGNWYTTGGVNLPSPYPDGYSVVGLNFMHPGGGAGQGGGDSFDHYTFAEYTLSTSGLTSVTDLSASTPSGGSNGTLLWVSVDNGPNLVAPINQLVPGGGSYTGPTSYNLTTLTAGERIYVGIGPNGSDGNDSTNIEFQIVQTPEPASLSVLGLGGVSLLARRRRV